MVALMVTDDKSPLHSKWIFTRSPTAITHGLCVLLVLPSVWQSHGNR
jgi:hypothetical protein